MGFIGGDLAYRFLKRFYPEGQGVPMPSGAVIDREKELGKLKLFLGNGIYDEFRNKTVVDFGCGSGWTCVELALNGVRHVTGIDIVEENLESGRKLAAEYGVSDKCTFALSTNERVDVVLSVDAFEHFGDPASILVKINELLKDDGSLIVSFGYTWYHPLGGHLFSVFPWAHLIFTEAALIRWRSDFKTDGATRFGEVAGGLNQMTIRRWEKLVAASPFEITWQKVCPIRAARWLYCSLTRELFTSTMQFKLVPKRS